MFFLRTSRFGQGSVVKTGPCSYLVKISPDVLNDKWNSGDMDKDPFSWEKKRIPITAFKLLGKDFKGNNILKFYSNKIKYTKRKKSLKLVGTKLNPFKALMWKIASKWEFCNHFLPD